MSAILSADDLNDFISPGVACIKPVETLPQKSAQSSENPYEVTTEDKVQPENAPPAQISLTDCLACSGCVTSAEAVLISLQSHTEVLNALDTYPEEDLSHHTDEGTSLENGTHNGGKKIFVASVSPQVRSGLAATYGISEREASFMIDQFLRGPQGLRAGGKHGSGFTWVVDTNAIREAVLVLSADEVAESLNTSELGAGDSPKRPILSSACPGWICYAEKTHPFILPHLSRLKSPQALTGTFLKTVLSKAYGVSPSQIWHLAIMPCFDKKLEASRAELTDASWRGFDDPMQHIPVRDVDCVITTRELLSLASSRGIVLSKLPLKAPPSNFTPSFPEKTLNSFLFSGNFQSRQTLASGTSGGYLYYVLLSFQSRHPNSEIVIQRGRNADVVEYQVVSPTGEVLLKAARYYGFRNIQNLVRKLKPARISRLPGGRNGPAASGASRRLPAARAGGSSTGSANDYAYVEVMACPGGCTNGGGQIRIEDAKQITADPSTDTVLDGASGETNKASPHEQRAWLARIDEAYYSAESDTDNPPGKTLPIQDKEAQVRQSLQYWANYLDIPLPKLVYTTYREVESDVGKPKDVGADTARVVELAGKIGGGW
ncbi:hypothetical protein ASPZODRAFT_112283 [Penicilliopsis zonata CBS 506.65]|uniref:Cytosolic Fe-S cluster assembly factor NAR1 n=1 Tax=Penicilliopsis zonata CBS 506.65 TaxID=1073090 RepID=A0A1L9SQ75_9EURO|nr:hypothetical protein ASPZODRAFT_112283 [Penicilliopsis zonata CBS 506.65]OJJ49395.1 hypothetical protein ASPZODRAFT_112283 [Penicilliopsis zonata CBS 506.65]